MVVDDGTKETLLPVMYDVHRRLHLMRATKAHVMRRGFGKHCRVISEVSTEQLLKAMALHGDNADVRELLRDPNIDPSLKRALGGVLQATSSIIGMEGHRSQIRLRGHAAGWHYGSAHLFVTPNLADIRSPLLLQLHLQDTAGTVEDCEVALDWSSEMPSMPTAAAMRRIVAMDPVSQARCFALMMDIFFEEVLGILPPLKRESYRAGLHATFEDGMASSLQGGVFGDVAALSGPLETQGRGSLHPHILIVLLGHDLGHRLRSIMLRIQHGELVTELRRWSQRVLDAVQRFKYDSQLVLAEQLGMPQQPLPLNERQRSECGQQYQSAALLPTEPDGHELEESGGRTLTGCYVSLRPSYQRREEQALGDGEVWKRKFCEDYRRLVIQNHFHKCTKSCFKKSLGDDFTALGLQNCYVCLLLRCFASSLFTLVSFEMFLFCVRSLPRRKAVKGKRGCRFGCFHIELIKDAEGKQKTICKKGWPRVQKACFSRLQYETEDLARQEEFKNENPHVFQAQRDHPFEGMSNPVAQVVMRCNVDVKYIGRAFAEEDLKKFCDGSMSSDLDESHTDGVHAQGHLRPVVPQTVAGSSQPELSERDLCDMDVGQQDTGGRASQDSGCKRKTTTVVGEQGHLRPVVPQTVAGSSQPELSERDLCDMDVGQQDTGGRASQDSGCKRKTTTVVGEQGHLRPVVPQPVAGSSQPELSERDLCDMDVAQQDTGGLASQDSGFKRKKTTVLSQSVPESKRMQTMKMALERVLIDMSRDMQDVGFYTGEYAAKKFEISRSMLPELYAGRICVVAYLFYIVIVIVTVYFVMLFLLFVLDDDDDDDLLLLFARLPSSSFYGCLLVVVFPCLLVVLNRWQEYRDWKKKKQSDSRPPWRTWVQRSLLA